MWPPYRVLRIKRAAYRAAQEAANLGPVIGYQVSIQSSGLHDIHNRTCGTACDVLA